MEITLVGTPTRLVRVSIPWRWPLQVTHPLGWWQTTPFETGLTSGALLHQMVTLRMEGKIKSSSGMNHAKSYSQKEMAPLHLIDSTLSLYPAVILRQHNPWHHMGQNCVPTNDSNNIVRFERRMCSPFLTMSEVNHWGTASSCFSAGQEDASDVPFLSELLFLQRIMHQTKSKGWCPVSYSTLLDWMVNMFISCCNVSMLRSWCAPRTKTCMVSMTAHVTCRGVLSSDTKWSYPQHFMNLGHL